jgi:acid stress-induced BolA-like protein IbaG/YrbA
MGIDAKALELPRPKRRGLNRVQVLEHTNLDAVIAAVREPGEELKRSGKSRTWRVHEWVVKSVCGAFPVRVAKLTFRRARYRRGWEAACFLRSRGIHVPEPVAYLERGFAGLVWDNAFVSDYLEDQVDVEVFMRALLKRNAGAETIAMFLQELADAVNAFTDTGAWHADLSGKNIYTADGRHFYFIDLDAVILDEELTDDRRLKNHVQLYDSFCDMLNDSVLVPFIERMLTPAHDPRVWMPSVRKGQADRRHEVEERWAREGKPSKHLEQDI